MKKIYRISTFVLFFFLFQNSSLSAQINVTLLTGQYMTNLYQMDTSGLGGNVEAVLDMNTLGPLEFISVLDDYKLNYVTRNGVGANCCFTVNLSGDTDSRQYFFSYNVIEKSFDPIKVYLKKGETKRLSLPIFDEANTVVTNLNNFSGGVFVDYNEIANNQPDLREVELTGLRHGFEAGWIQYCDPTGQTCEFLMIEMHVMDTSRYQLPNIDTIANYCNGGYFTACQGIKRTDRDYDTFEYLIDGEPYNFSGFQDTCGFQTDAVEYRLSSNFNSNTDQYIVTSWWAGTTFYSGYIFKTSYDLRAWMDLVEPDADWQIRGTRITGTRNGRDFGLIEVERLSDGLKDEFGETYKTQWIDIVQPEIPAGQYELSIRYPNFDFTTSTLVDIECPDFMTGTTRFFDTLIIGESRTVGVFPPNIRFVESANANVPPTSDQVVEFAWSQQMQNMTYTAFDEGTSQFEIIFCDPQDRCDTLFYEVVSIQQPPPPSGNITFTNPPDADKTIDCNDSPIWNMVAAETDCPDGFVDITFIDSTAFNGCSGSLTYYRFWTVRDNCQGVLTQTQIIRKEDNVSPMLVSFPGDLNLECFDMITDNDPPIFSDNCTANLDITYTDFQNNGNCPDVIIERIWAAIDDCGNLTTYTQMITKKNEGPILMMPAHPVVDIFCTDTSFNDPPVFEHLCGLDFDVSYSDVQTGTGSCNDIMTTRTWVATDVCGLMTTDEQIFHFIDNEPPMLEQPYPDDLFLDETMGDQIPPPWQPTATDNCDTDVEIIVEDYIFERGDMETIEIHRTYTAIDDCGNQEHHLQTIEIRTDPVWPGDTDDDGDVDGEDLFPIGFAFGERGGARPNSNWFFSPQPMLNWEKDLPGAGNFKHIDSDGSGEIGFWDTMAIQINWGLSHPRIVPTKEVLITEDLSVDFVSLDANGWAHFDVMLGDGQTNIEDFYGLAYDFIYDVDLAHPDSAFADYSTSWAGVPNSDLVSVQKSFGGNKILKTSIARTDKNGKNGSGKLGRIRLKLRAPYPANINVNIPTSKGIYQNGDAFETVDYAQNFDLTSGTNDISNLIPFEIAPNPTAGDLVLNILENESKNYQIEIHDLLGKKLKSFESNYRTSVKIDLNSLANGTYLLSLFDGEGKTVKRIVKQ